MCEPLSVAASIAGLFTLAGQLYKILDKFVNDTRDAPSFANCILVEVDAYRKSLHALQILLGSQAFPSHRAALIPSDFVVLTCTDATLLFSELEAEVTTLIRHDEHNFFARTRWAQKRSKLEGLVSRLQWQKMTLVLQLNILKYASDRDAQVELATLTTSCMQKLVDNQDLARRLEQVELQQRQQQSVLLETLSIRSAARDSLTANTQSAGQDHMLDELTHHPFEEALLASWVYRRNQDRPESMSICDSTGRQSAWSALSGISLAQWSAISVINLPIQRSELFNTQWYGPATISNPEHPVILLQGEDEHGSHDELESSGVTAHTEKPMHSEYEQSDRLTMSMEQVNGLQNSSNVQQRELHLAESTQDHTTPAEKHEHPTVEGCPDTGRIVKTTMKLPPVLDQLVSRALRKAHTAVLLDNAHNYEGAFECYTEVCKLLDCARRISTNDAIKIQLKELSEIYSGRVRELVTFSQAREEMPRTMEGPDLKNAVQSNSALQQSGDIENIPEDEELAALVVEDLDFVRFF